MCITVHYGFTYLCMQCFMCQSIFKDKNQNKLFENKTKKLLWNMNSAKYEM
ncbi:hypothetical protein T4B_631 [Trichinella pseudospiralis]|uniref:Uncharacterized protein n=1 Tax=Trichinella pseudospiralis TaxID=6337 RepID=A0A0V1GEP0_TRIPS|nr:hypothetical protein T4B_631 [Trichinella pseudospiralis]